MEFFEDQSLSWLKAITLMIVTVKSFDDTIPAKNVDDMLKILNKIAEGEIPNDHLKNENLKMKNEIEKGEFLTPLEKIHSDLQSHFGPKLQSHFGPNLQSHFKDVLKECDNFVTKTLELKISEVPKPEPAQPKQAPKKEEEEEEDELDLEKEVSFD